MKERRVRDINYLLLPGTERKTTDIVIERNGVITVRPPIGLCPAEVDAVVEKKLMWIYRNLAEWRDLNRSSVVREWVNGESFLYLGRNYRLTLVSDQGEDLKLKEGRFCLNRSLIDKGGPVAAKKAFESFYTIKGERLLKKRILFFAPKVDVVPSGIKVKELGYRWGICTNTHSLFFHWKCIMAPLKIIDYIVVHELCHIHHRNHTNAFWNEVDKILPDYRERKIWLRNHGAGLSV